MADAFVGGVEEVPDYERKSPVERVVDGYQGEMEVSYRVEEYLTNGVMPWDVN